MWRKINIDLIILFYYLNFKIFVIRILKSRDAKNEERPSTLNNTLTLANKQTNICNYFK